MVSKPFQSPPGGVPEALPGAGLEKYTKMIKTISLLGPFFDPGADFRALILSMVSGHPPGEGFYNLGAQKASKTEAF